MSNDARKIALESLLKYHCDSTKFGNGVVIDQAASLFVFLSDEYVRKASNETFYFLPYREITNFIFENECKFNSDEFLSFTSVVYEKMQTLSEYNQSPYKDYLGECYNKLTLHISLAQVQKNQIIRVTENAYKVAKKAEKIAEDADAQAKSTIANYISILGIFASIIFTLFGGVNLIGSTVKLLEVNSRWPYLTFIIALLMICLLTLLNMMVKWINSMSNLKRALENQNMSENEGVEEFNWCEPKTWDFYTKSVSGFLIILIVSLVGMYSVNKENLFTLTTETTTKTPPKVEENTPQKPTGVEENTPQKPAGVEGNIPKADLKQESNGEAKEITIVEKFTLSNHSNEKSSDKEE